MHSISRRLKLVFFSTRFFFGGIPMPLRNTRFEPGNRAVSGSPKLGTFLGLYTPTILTILGVIMYLRFGWLVALAYGAAGHYHAGMFSATVPSGDVAFWTGFAVFFPAATGVMAGLGLSGDLKEPGISIPVGSLLAVVTGFAVYLFVPFLLIMGADAASLRNDSLIWTKVAPFGTWLVLPALFGAIFSSAIGSMLTAPRSLYALSSDRAPVPGPRHRGLARAVSRICRHSGHRPGRRAAGKPQCGSSGDDHVFSHRLRHRQSGGGTGIVKQGPLLAAQDPHSLAD
jgi:hypothetical protein